MCMAGDCMIIMHPVGGRGSMPLRLLGLKVHWQLEICSLERRAAGGKV